MNIHSSCATAHLENAIKTVRMEYFAFLVAIVTDASGECHKAHKDLAPKYPTSYSLIVMLIRYALLLSFDFHINTQILD